MGAWTKNVTGQKLTELKPHLLPPLRIFKSFFLVLFNFDLFIIDVDRQKSFIPTQTIDEQILNQEQLKDSLYIETSEFDSDLTGRKSQIETQNTESSDINAKIVPDIIPHEDYEENEMLTLAQALEEDSFQEPVTPTTKSNIFKLLL